MRNLKVLAVVGTAIASALMMVPGTAFAESWNSVAGTVPSNGNWYLSATVRTNTGPTIEIQLTSLNNGGNDWRLFSTYNGTYFSNTVNIEDNNTHVLATSVITGTQFQNSFKADHGYNNWFYNYSFSGSEYY